MYKTTAIVMILLGTLWLSACSTVAGVGKDIQNVGSSIEKGANKEKKRM